MNTTSLAQLARNQFGTGNPSKRGLGKSGPKIEKMIKAANKKKEKEEKHLQMMKALYSNQPVELKPKKRVGKKKTVIDPEVLAKISNIDIDAVEKALKMYLEEKLKDVVLAIGENGKTVTLASVLKVLKSI